MGDGIRYKGIDLSIKLCNLIIMLNKLRVQTLNKKLSTFSVEEVQRNLEAQGNL